MGAAEPPVDEGADTSLSERTQAQDGGFDDDFSASFGEITTCCAVFTVPDPLGF